MSNKDTEKLEVDFSDLKEVFDKLIKEVEGKRDEKDWKWDLTITRESNGYVLDGAISGGRARTVIEDDDKDELKSGEELLWQISEYFGIQGSRYDRERLYIVRKRGDKYEPETKQDKRKGT